MSESARGIDPAHSERARGRLTGELVASGVLRSPRWIAAFKETPREDFAPSFVLDDGRVRRTCHSGDADYLDALYTDDSLITQIDPGGTATSSSTMPSLMAHMLEAFAVEDDAHVLEVGTGTGYNTALLCHALGGERVTTIDIDPVLTHSARRRLNRLGLKPDVRTGDGRQGSPREGGYGGVLATCAVKRIPTAWLRQLGAGSLIVVNIGSGIACLRSRHDGGAAGGFLNDPYMFMTARSSPHERVPRAAEHINLAMGSEGDRTVLPLPETGGDPHTFLREMALCEAMEVHLHQSDVLSLMLTPDTGVEQCLLVHPGSQSWARVSVQKNALVVRYGGPPSTMAVDRIRLLEGWMRAGRPSPGAYKLEVSSGGLHTLWRGEGGPGTTWTLPG
ncbi:methyltransferase domain-containing protein [Streptomyces xiamenensis]|uniref:methyltransferase domain-containing protein n=1 Tax=Streptomyces xiamenensis TaxID=408015 RepID=UPI0037CF6C4E